MNAWQITKKDLRLLLRDRRTLFILVALPLIFITILGMSTGQFLTMQDKNQLIQIAIVNDDPGELAAQLVENLRRKAGLDAKLVVNREEALGKLETGIFMTVISIGTKFQERAKELTVADILYVDEGRLSEGLKSLDIEVICRAAFMNTEGIVRQLGASEAWCNHSLPMSLARTSSLLESSTMAVPIWWSFERPQQANPRRYKRTPRYPAQGATSIKRSSPPTR